MKKQFLFLAFCLLTISSFAQIDTTGSGSGASDIDVTNFINIVFHLLTFFGVNVKFQGTIIAVVLFLWHWAYKRFIKSKHADALKAATSGTIPEKKSWFKRVFGKK